VRVELVLLVGRFHLPYELAEESSPELGEGDGPDRAGGSVEFVEDRVAADTGPERDRPESGAERRAWKKTRTSRALPR
jgi:hypothetical protein